MDKGQILDVIIGTINKRVNTNNYYPEVESLLYQTADDLRKAFNKEFEKSKEIDDIKPGLSD